jgi:hypothetical protein
VVEASGDHSLRSDLETVAAVVRARFPGVVAEAVPAAS